MIRRTTGQSLAPSGNEQTPAGMVLDLFAGPGGWSQGLRMLGLSDIGIEWDDTACRTRKAAGHLTIRADVATYPTEPFVGKVTGLIASPPCQEFSRANAKRQGVRSDRGELVWQVVRWAAALRPDWIACEQVPDVLQVWRAIAHELRSLGYSTVTGVLNSADYGVAQTRERAIMLGALGRAVTFPAPTHSSDGGVGLFGTLPKWVTMGDALEWDEAAALAHARWTEGTFEQFHADAVTDVPVYVNGNQRNAARRRLDEPAPTVHFGHASNDVRWVFRRPATTVVGSFSPDVIAAPAYRTDVSRQNAPGSVRVSIPEAAVLQSFPADYPWQGSDTKKREQIGNAIPPLLAAHVLSSVTGIPLAQEAAA